MNNGQFILFILNTKVVGYEVKMLEYHDLKGKFHKAEYSEEGGRVSR